MSQPKCPKCGARSGMIWSVADRTWYCLYDSAWVAGPAPQAVGTRAVNAVGKAQTRSGLAVLWYRNAGRSMTDPGILHLAHPRSVGHGACGQALVGAQPPTENQAAHARWCAICLRAGEARERRQAS